MSRMWGTGSSSLWEDSDKPQEDEVLQELNAKLERPPQHGPAHQPRRGAMRKPFAAATDSPRQHGAQRAPVTPSLENIGIVPPGHQSPESPGTPSSPGSCRPQTLEAMTIATVEVDKHTTAGMAAVMVVATLEAARRIGRTARHLGWCGVGCAGGSAAGSVRTARLAGMAVPGGRGRGRGLARRSRSQSRAWAWAPQHARWQVW